MDDIQRQLELIDKQLRGRWDFHRELTGTAPLVFIAVGLISGICVQHYIPIGVWLWLLICACFFAAGAILFLIQRKNNHILLISMPYVALLCAVCLGGIRLINYKRAAPNDISHFVKDERTLATIRGVVISYPYTNYNKGWTFEKFSFNDPSGSFYLKLTEAETVDGWTSGMTVITKLRLQTYYPLST